MDYKAIDIAKNIIKEYFNQDKRITNLKLQKILYFAQGNSYMLYGEPMFCDDICAWKYGPVVEEVYNEYSWRRSFSILEPRNVSTLDKRAMDIIKSLVEDTKDMNAWDLVDITHSEGPWKDVFDNGGSVISKDKIKEYWEGIRDN